MAERPSALLAELLENASTENRRVVTAWLLESRLGMSAAAAEDYWAVRRMRAAQVIGELSPGESRLVTVRLPQDVHGELEDWCTEHGFSTAAVVRGLVERFVAERRAAGGGEPA